MNNIWHNSNEEQPDGKRRTVCYCLNTNGGEVGIHTIVNPNYRWAYLEDLDPKYVECGNCVNDKGCIVCEHGDQKQLYRNNIMNENKMYIVRQYNSPNEMEDAINILVHDNFVPFEIFYDKGYYNVVYKKMC